MAHDYEALVRKDRVHSKIFTSPEIFEEELQKIFYRWWVYVGHSSEVPETGDYILKWIGRQSVIMTRDSAGDVHLLMNRCRHRAAAVCQSDRGNSSFFRCQYHGWTYKNNGSLVGVPYPKAYGDGFAKEDLGLTAVPRTGNYRGFIFASLSPVGISFDDFLGPRTKEIIDYFVNGSPEGEIEVRSGVQQGYFHGNWKFVGMDGYHPSFLHSGVEEIVRKRDGSGGSLLKDVYSEKSPNLTWDLGNGHARLDLHPGKEAVLNSLTDKISSSPAGRKYVELMRERYGDAADDVIQRSGDPHLGLWPNLQLIGVQIRVIRPLSADKTQVDTYPVLLKGVPPEVNESRMRQQEWFYGPAGFGSPDDYEMFERNQVGLMAEVDPWLILSRGLDREQHNGDGTIVGNITDEVTQRAQMRQWKRVMTMPDMASADAPGFDRSSPEVARG